jgi:hypothetical protein
MDRSTGGGGGSTYTRVLVGSQHNLVWPWPLRHARPQREAIKTAPPQFGRKKEEAEMRLEKATPGGVSIQAGEEATDNKPLLSCDI